MSDEDPEALPGFEYVWEPDDGAIGGAWSLDPKHYAGYPCRWTVGPGHKTCGRPADAALNRGRSGRDIWFAYCRDHLYGRRIVDGVVEVKRMKKIDG